MLNPATTRATPAKASSADSTSPRKSLAIAASSSAVRSAPVSTSLPPPAAAATAFRRPAASTPSSARTSTDVSWSGPVNQAWAVSWSTPAKVAPAMASRSPNPTMPTTSDCTTSGTRSSTRSPRVRPPVLAEPASMTTSPGPAGARPSRITKGLSSGSSIHAAPTVGGPPPPMASPSDPTIWATPSTSAATAATPGTAATRAATASSVVPRRNSSLPCSPNPVSLRTARSIPALASPNSPAKPVRMVSLNTRVAHRKATPSTMASPVPTVRRLSDRRRRRLSRIMPPPCDRGRRCDRRTG